MTIPEYDAAIIARVPYVPWRRPIRLFIGVRLLWGCRLCIARLGFNAQDQDGKAFNNMGEWTEHQRDVHERVETK